MENTRDFVISTDTCADLPFSYYEENNVNLLALGYTVDGQTFRGDDRTIDVHKFYNDMRVGKMPVTMQVNPEQAEQSFEALVKSGVDILHLAFSSGLSGTYSSTHVGAVAVRERNPGARITVIDTLAASMGQGLLVHLAVEMKKAGKTMDEIAAWVTENRNHLVHYFTVEDLNHLHRGGRVSKAAAIVGTALGIKPLLYVDEAGHLLPMSKVRGRKQSLTALIDRMGPKLEGFQNEIVFISHGDCLADAEYCAAEIKRRYGIARAMMNPVGAVIGTHSGPGTIAIFFLGKDKKE